MIDKLYTYLYKNEIVKEINTTIIPNIYPNRYYVTSFGRAFSINKSSIRELIPDNSSMAQRINMRDKFHNGIKISLYRLVLMAFNPIDNMNNLEVGHKDGNYLNNKLENLYWRDGSYLNYVQDNSPFVDFSEITDHNDMILPVTELQVPNIKPIYFVSNTGNIYSISGNGNRKIIKLKYYNVKGYYRVTLYTNDNKSKHIFVHRLVLSVFRYRSDFNDLLVNHKDTNTLNNYVDIYNNLNDNIEWCTSLYNSIYMVKCGNAYNQKLNEDQIKEIINLINKNIPIKDIAKKYNVGIDTIYGIKNKKIYKPMIMGGMDQWQI